MNTKNKSKRLWSKEDNVEAHKEGWGIFSEDGILRIHRLDDPEGFAIEDLGSPDEDDDDVPVYKGPDRSKQSDEDVVEELKKRAARGDSLVQRAFAYIEQKNKKFRKVFIVKPNGHLEIDHRHDVCVAYSRAYPIDIYTDGDYEVVAERQSLKAAQSYVTRVYGIKRIPVI